MTSPEPTASDPCVTAKTAFQGEQLALSDHFALTEYNNLRMEILKMIELQSQLTSLTVISFGAVMSVGFETRNPAIMAVHPILALILGICWLNHAFGTVRAADYIRSRLEARLYGKSHEGWEHFVLDYRLPHARIGYLGVRAIFPGSSTLAVIAAIYVGANNFASIAAIIAAAVTALMTIGLFLIYREPTPGITFAINSDEDASGRLSH